MITSYQAPRQYNYPIYSNNDTFWNYQCFNGNNELIPNGIIETSDAYSNLNNAFVQSSHMNEFQNKLIQNNPLYTQNITNCKDVFSNNSQEAINKNLQGILNDNMTCQQQNLSEEKINVDDLIKSARMQNYQPLPSNISQQLNQSQYNQSQYNQPQYNQSQHNPYTNKKILENYYVQSQTNDWFKIILMLLLIILFIFGIYYLYKKHKTKQSVQITPIPTESNVNVDKQLRLAMWN